MTTPTINLDGFVLDSLMTDLVGHDRRPGAYIVYLALLRLIGGRTEIGISLQDLAISTGLSKTAVQRSIAHLADRQLVATRSEGATQARYYRVLQPWRRDGARKRRGR